MRILFALALMLPQDPPEGAIDRKALETLLAKKNLKLADFGWDFDHLNSMPPRNVASHAAPKVDRGHTKLFRDVQKAPLTFPDRMHEIARAAAGFSDWGALLATLSAAIDRPFDDPKPAPPAADDLSKLPEPLRKPAALLLGACDAALAEPDLTRAAVIVLRAIDATRVDLAAFKGDVDFEIAGRLAVTTGTARDPNVMLTVDLGGDDTYKGRFAGADAAAKLRVVLDFAGNDTYSADGISQGAGDHAIGILCDFAGNDRYAIDKESGQGYGDNGVGILLDAAGDDTYWCANQGQGAATDGIGILVDRAGDDKYECAMFSQGASYRRAAALLLDLDGNDDYLAHDPLHGKPLVNPAPQDEKHSANMCMGSASGDRTEFKTGGIALLVDARGNDRYRAGCWAMGAGYFLALAALIDLEGDDLYHAWVYTTGCGAHGGFGLLSDRRGDDTYQIDGWNCLGMAVDYGMGMALDGAGHDRYTTASGLGWNVGLGIALFQDSGGDDVYTPRDNNLGYGRFYEDEDYNHDKQITPAEKRHWGIFLDLAGLDRYPASSKGKNAAQWDPSEYAGGLDVASPRPPWKVPDAWEDLAPAEILKLGAAAPAKDRAAFALEHGLYREAVDLLPPSDAEARFGKAVMELRERARTTKEIDALVRDCAKAPPLGRALVQDALAARLEAWLATLKPLLEKKAALEKARADVIAADAASRPASVRKLQSLWAARAHGPVKVDPVVRAIVAALDAGWRARLPVAAANAAVETLTLESVALTPAERDVLSRARPKGPPAIDKLNDYRAMLGRAPVAADADLAKLSADAASAQGKGAKPANMAQVVVKARSLDEALADWLAADHAALVDTKWAAAGAGAGGGWFAITLR